MILNKKNVLLFKEAYSIYNTANHQLEKELKGFEFFSSMNLRWKKENFILSFKNNFFSLLMTVLLIEGCNKKNIIDYLKIITCIRQCVTSTDNIIDNEDKGVIFIEGISNVVVKNTLITMTSQNILEKVSIGLREDNSISREILNTIYRIAQAESRRDSSQYKGYPSSEYIRAEIHRGIGGELLEIAMVAPKINEPSKKLEDLSKGLFEIGMALQALDDFCDINEDIIAKKVNYTVAKLLEAGHTIEEISNSEYETDEYFNKDYIREVLETAYRGFDCLIENGFPLNKKDIKGLLKHLFNIRGLGKLWNMAS